MKLVITHFFNEEYLLPWWLKHHREQFDQGILIDYNSTDRSVEICRELAPHWEVVRTPFDTFAALKLDFEVMQHEARYPDAWKVALNTTEFLVGSGLDRAIDRMDREKVLGGWIPGAVMVDTDPDSVPSADLPLTEQKTSGFWENSFDFVQIGSTWLNKPYRSRLLHRYLMGAYTPGRHESFLPDIVHLDQSEIGNWWYGFSPWNREFLMRKLQIRDQVDPLDVKASMGFQHMMADSEVQKVYETLQPFSSPLKIG